MFWAVSVSATGSLHSEQAALLFLVINKSGFALCYVPTTFNLCGNLDLWNWRDFT